MTTPRSTGQRKRLTIVLALTGLYLVAEVVGGLVTGSLALIADAGHMLTDAGGLGLALLAMRFAERPATPTRTYGFYRAEILAALANAVVLLAVSIYILIEAYRRFRSPPEVSSTAMLIVAGVGLLVNLAGILLLRGSAGESLNMRGAYFEVLSDLLTSIGVIVAGVIMLTTGWYYADPLISALIGLLIFPRTWALLREAVGVLLEGVPVGVDLGAVRDAIGLQQGVVGLHDLHVWSLTSGMTAMSVHVVSDAPDRDELLARLHAQARELGMAHVTVQIEQPGWETKETHL